MSGLVDAFRMLTRLPLGAGTSDRGPLKGVAGWFPVVGLIVGLVVGGIYALLYPWVPSMLSAVVAVAFGVVFTGAFHEDGLADSLDALGTGESGDGALAVMRDPRLGTYGTLAVVFSVLWRVVALGSLAPVVAVSGLVAAHVLGRTGAVTLMAIAPAARDDGLGRLGIASLDARSSVAAVTVGTGVGLVALGWWVGVAAVLMVAAVALVARFISMRRIGGITGDILGACEQLGEMACLGLVAAVAWGGWSPWWL